MPEPLTLTVPAPWGLALVLGLRTCWHHHRPAPAGLALPARLAIVQERAANDYAGVMRHLDHLCRRRGLGPLACAIPWDYTLPGLMGQADLVACAAPWRARAGLAHGWRWDLINPRPAWAEAEFRYGS